jgi:hypothetical protein
MEYVYNLNDIAPNDMGNGLSDQKNKQYPVWNARAILTDAPVVSSRYPVLVLDSLILTTGRLPRPNSHDGNSNKWPYVTEKNDAVNTLSVSTVYIRDTSSTSLG